MSAIEHSWKVARASSIVFAMLASSAASAAGSEVLEGRLSQITHASVTVEGIATLVFRPASTQCFDPRGAALTCETLIGIGYADRARVTVRGDEVRRIDLLELQQ